MRLWERITQLGSSIRRAWKAFKEPCRPKSAIPVSPGVEREIKDGERVYVLYVGLREYNGNFREEITFRNCWETHEAAQLWLKLMEAEISLLMQKSGVNPQTIERTFFGEGEGQQAEEEGHG